MFNTSRPDEIGVDTVEPAGHPPRQFGRLRPPPPVEQPDQLAAMDDEPVILPFDSTKTFVGPNGTYYDERWRWMEWRGQGGSWNWAAALSFGGWFAYRRLYGITGLYAGWLGLCLTLALNGAPLSLLGTLQLAVIAATGLYGNLVYRQYFRRVAFRVARDHREHAARLTALARAGGTDRWAVCAMIAAVLAIAVALVAWMRMTGAGIELNFW